MYDREKLQVYNAFDNLYQGLINGSVNIFISNVEQRDYGYIFYVEMTSWGLILFDVDKNFDPIDTNESIHKPLHDLIYTKLKKERIRVLMGYYDEVL